MAALMTLDGTTCGLVGMLECAACLEYDVRPVGGAPARLISRSHLSLRVLIMPSRIEVDDGSHAERRRADGLHTLRPG